MAYSDKVWKDSPDHTTPLSAAGLNDWEARIKAETDALSVLVASEATARAAADVRANIVADKNERRIFHDDGDLTNNWAVTTAGAGTITAALDSDAAGGNTITMTTGGSNAIDVTTAPAKQPRNYGANTSLVIGKTRPWVFTTEMQLSGTTPVGIIEFKNGATTLFALTVGYNFVTPGLSPGAISFTGSGLTTSAQVPTGFTQTQKFRLLTWCDPTTGVVRHYLWFTNNSTGVSDHLYLGSQQLSSMLTATEYHMPAKVTCRPWAFSSCTVKITRTRMYEVFGVMNGCSTEQGWNVFDMNPNQLASFTGPDDAYNPTAIFTKRCNGASDFGINMAHVSYKVADMLSEFPAWVSALRPKVIVLGSATNSMAEAAALTGAAQTANIAAAKADYLSMCALALAVTPAVVAHTAEPRHDASFNTAPKRQLLADWNVWMRATLPPLGVAVADCYAALNDPAADGQLVPWADGGDHVHFSKRAIEVRADAAYHALASLDATS